MSISNQLPKDACVAQLGTLLTRVQLQAPFTEIGQEVITGLPWACAISPYLPATPQNVSVCWRTSLWCFFCWGFSAAAALRLDLCPSPMFWLSAELTQWLPVLRCSFWSLHRWASSETRGAAQRPLVTDRSVKPHSMVWPKSANPIIYFFLNTDSVLVKGKGRPVENLNEKAANSALFQQLSLLGFRGTAFHWQKWEMKRWPALFRKWRKTTWFRDSPLMAEKFFLKETIKALVAERFNLPPSNVKGSISIGVAGTAWAPAWRTSQHSLKRDGPGQPLQFGLVSIAQFWGQNFQAEVPGIRHQTLGTPVWLQGTSCSALMASWRTGRDRSPQAQGKEGHRPLHLLRCPAKALYSRGAR